MVGAAAVVLLAGGAAYAVAAEVFAERGAGGIVAGYAFDPYDKPKMMDFSDEVFLARVVEKVKTLKDAGNTVWAVEILDSIKGQLRTGRVQVEQHGYVEDNGHVSEIEGAPLLQLGKDYLLLTAEQEDGSLFLLSGPTGAPRADTPEQKTKLKNEYSAAAKVESGLKKPTPPREAKQAQEAKAREKNHPNGFTVCLKPDGTLATEIVHEREQGAPPIPRAEKERLCADRGAVWTAPKDQGTAAAPAAYTGRLNCPRGIGTSVQGTPTPSAFVRPGAPRTARAALDRFLARVATSKDPYERALSEVAYARRADTHADRAVFLGTRPDGVEYAAVFLDRDGKRNTWTMTGYDQCNGLADGSPLPSRSVS